MFIHHVLNAGSANLGPMVRSHWAIENSLHWVMDMTFRDDECRIRTEYAPANFNTLRHMAHNLVRKAPGKDSLRLRRKTAAWNDYLATLIDFFACIRRRDLRTENGPQPNKETSLQLWLRYFAELDAHNLESNGPLSPQHSPMLVYASVRVRR